MEIGVVTTCWGDYGRYLPEWIACVDAQRHRPARVTILDAGVYDPEPALLELARSELNWQWVKEPYQGMGQARNDAVRHTDTEWVMHLDADDFLLPHALSDAAEIAPECDVICMGAIRRGEEVTFPRKVARGRVLSARLATFSASPFRRWLWEKRPYITANDWVDSALWVGFAHAGARFRGTTRPGFVYRDHPDSHSATISAEDKLAARQQLVKLCKQWDNSL